MALTRKFLAALGIEQDKIDEIIDNHTETVNALKEERNQYKEDAEKLPGIQKELDDLKKAAEKNGENPYKAQYDDLKKEFDEYKAGVTEKELKAKKTEAYRELLKDIKVSDKRIDAILKVSDVGAVELDDEGNLKGADDLKKTLKTEWADFIVSEEQKGAETKTPPQGDGGGRIPSRAKQLAEQYTKNLYGTGDAKEGAK